MMYPLVRELAAQDAPIRVPVTVTCRVLNLARAPYYRWLANPVTDADWVAAHRANALFDAHRDDPEFGYRLLADEARDAGQDMCDRTAWAICSGNAWWSVFGKKRSTRPRPGPPAHDDRVQRDFTATGPNQLWLTDIPPSTSCREVPRLSTAPVRARCTCAPSRTCGPTGSSGTRSAHG